MHLLPFPPQRQYCGLSLAPCGQELVSERGRCVTHESDACVVNEEFQSHMRTSDMVILGFPCSPFSS